MKRKGKGIGMALAAAVLGMGLMLTAPAARAPVDEESAVSPAPAAPSAQSAAESGERIRAGCEITQTMRFSRCGHSVTRRITAPASVTGLDFASAQEYYGLWQLESYSSGALTMSREIPLFCPMHAVLAVNEAGEVVLTRNQYGDGMAVVQATERSAEKMDPETREALRLGMGFDSEEEALAWLRAH